MTALEALLVGVIGAVDRGHNVGITGQRLSGRSSLIKNVAAHFRSRRRKVLVISGLPMLKDSPLGAIGLCGYQERTPYKVAAEIEEAIGNGSGLIMVDDWEHLDHESWAALVHVHRTRKIPVVAARGYDLRNPGPFALSGVDVARQFEVPMLEVHDLGRRIASKLPFRLDAMTLARTAALSGGNIGIALAIVEAALEADMFHIEGGVGTVSEHSLWTDAAGMLADSLVAPLSRKQRDALQLIAAYGPFTSESVIQSVDSVVLDQLLDLGHVVFTSIGRPVEEVALATPLFDEYLRRKANQTTGTTTGADVSTPHMSTVLDGAPDTRPFPSAGEMLAAGYIHAHRTVAEATRGWAQSSSVSTAATLVDALQAAFAPQEEIERILVVSQDMDGDDDSVASWEALNFTHFLTVRGDHAAVRERLLLRQEQYPALLAQFQAAIAIADLYRGEEPELALLPSSFEGLDLRSERTVHTVRLTVHLLRGRVSDARAHYLWLAAQDALTADEQLLLCLMEIADGDHTLVETRINEAFRDARASMNWRAISPLTYIAGLNSAFTGRSQDAYGYYEELYALGAPMTNPQAHQGVNSTAVENYAREHAERPAEFRTAPQFTFHSVLPASTLEWQRGAELLVDGHPEAASELLAEHADDLWSVGHRYASAVTYLYAAYADPRRELVAKLEERVGAIGGSGFQMNARFLAMVCRGELESAARLIRELDALGSCATTANGWRTLARGWVKRGDASRAEEYLSRADAVAARPRPDDGFGDRFKMKSHSRPWTAREREVVRYVVSGLSNMEIAETLVLSKRTVETHLARAMKKARVRSRSQLAGLFAMSVR